MDMKLKVLEGKNAGKELAVNGKKFLIGRAEDCHLRAGSELISRHHCAILVEEGYIGVRDFGSKNGTFVNDERIVGERELKTGDRLTVGPLRFEVHLAHGIGAKKQPPVHDVKEAVARTATNAAKDPVDVTEWLSSEASAETATHETTSFTDTDAMDLNATQAGQDSPGGKKKDKKEPGKLPKVLAKDSQDAAASVLSAMRRRR
ncbi:MAG: FHA domain-containing protein [Planctomycetota bacterium]|nr:MAG: FHA domain-containing protein [Planctomycetota bacterium]